MKSSTGAHYLGLDHVRAIAAFMVFSWHFLHAADGHPVPFGSAPVIFPLALLDEGHTGVALFMTLSGYLFAKLLDGKDVDYFSFLWNRFVRLAPLMFLVLIIDASIEIYHGSSILTTIKKYIKGVILPNLPSGLWSVTVELHFYLCLPILLIFFRKSPFALIAILISTIIARLFLCSLIGEVQFLSYWTIVGRIDDFALGIFAFHLSHLFQGRHFTAIMIALTFSAFYWLFDYEGGFYNMPSYPSPNLIWVIMPTIEGAAYACLIAYYDTSFSPRNYGASWIFGLIGSYSYSIYLLHFFVVFRLSHLINDRIMDISNFYIALCWTILSFFLMLPVGFISFKYIESPFLKFRIRYIKSAETPQI